MSARTKTLRDETMAACLQVSTAALAIFDDVEAERFTIETAKDVVKLGHLANMIHAGVRAIVLTDGESE